MTCNEKLDVQKDQGKYVPMKLKCVNVSSWFDRAGDSKLMLVCRQACLMRFKRVIFHALT